MEAIKNYDAHIDNKKRITLRGARYTYYNVKEYANGCIMLEPRELLTYSPTAYRGGGFWAQAGPPNFRQVLYPLTQEGQRPALRFRDSVTVLTFKILPGKRLLYQNRIS